VSSSVGDRIKSAIARARLSQRELSRLADVPLATLGTWLQKGRTPRPEQLQKVARVLQVSQEWLLEGGAELGTRREQPFRVIEFPSDYSFGTLLQRSRAGYFNTTLGAGQKLARFDEDNPSAWEYLGEAKGKVLVHKGWDIKLVAAQNVIPYRLQQWLKDGQYANLFQSLSLNRQGITDDQLTDILSVEGLKHLSLAGTDAGDQTLKRLSEKLPGLRSLDFTSTRVTDEGLKWLGHLKFLRVLRLDDTSIYGRGFGDLKPLDSLKRLSLRRTKIDDGMLGSLRAARSLESLDLTSTKTGADDLSGLLPLPNLRTLVLERTKTNDRTVKALVGLKQLEELELSGTDVGNQGMKSVGQLKKLTRLGLVATAVDDDGVKELRALSKLSDLRLRMTRVTDKSLETIRFFTKLQTLWLQETRITGEGLSGLRDELKELGHLWLWGADITDRGLEELATITSLVEVGIGGTLISDIGLEALHVLPNLRQLSVGHTPQIGDAGIVRLIRSAKPLQELDVAGTGISPVGRQRALTERPDIYLDRVF
jgi:internalin A